MSSLKYWVWLSAMTNLRPIIKFQLLEAFGGPEEIYFADQRLLMEKLELRDNELDMLGDKSLDRVQEILEACRREDADILTIADAAYPKRLKNIFDPPAVLYVKGRLPAVDELPVIAVVGTRKATPYGIKMGRIFGSRLTTGGGLVATGLAQGVDSAAAEGALRAGGSCIGVLGCPIDEVYPLFNEALYNDVAAVGALVSEYPPGSVRRPANFPERNRLISGLAVGVTIIEAPKHSGALITASLALEQGREVFAVPGNADAPNCAGSNELIREGATLVTTGWDVLSEFKERFPNQIKGPDEVVPVPEEEPAGVYPGAGPRAEHERNEGPETGKGFAKLRVRNERKNVDKAQKREYIVLKEQLEGLTENQLKIVSVMDAAGKHVDDIIDASALPAATVLAELTLMQIKGFVAQESGKRFSLSVQINDK